MRNRTKDLLPLALMLAVLILMYAQILFTGKIIRAPDLLHEHYWVVLDMAKLKLQEIFLPNMAASWDLFTNSGNTIEGGEVGTLFLLLQRLIYQLFPLPSAVAWFIVLHFFIGGAGTYLYCRAIGTSRVAAFFGGLIFALAPEHASLINAGHIMKIGTIAFAPWAFYCYEKALQERRVVWFLATGFVLAYQFFYTHWQIAFYTCLCIGIYGVVRSLGIVLDERSRLKRTLPRLLGLNLLVLLFFLSTVAVSLAPLANWSTGTNRGIESGANQGKGGLNREEAMLWSMPPEEVVAFVVPGLFGFSRQEGGENPTNIQAYYWGRMVFTQTTSYFGLLPWLLLPLPLVFRRDRYTWLATAAIIGCVLFSMGKYTPFYNFLFDHVPGINRFRVPKMMLFLVVFFLGVLTARGMDCLLDEELRKRRGFRWYLWGIAAVPVLLVVSLGVLKLGEQRWLSLIMDLLAQPTRYEEGPQLVLQRWHNLLVEIGIAALMATFSAAVIFVSCWRRLAPLIVASLLAVLFLVDVGRVNAKFMFLVDEPTHSRGKKTPAMEFISRDSNQYRTLPLAGDPMSYAAAKVPVLFTSFAVQQQRWQNFLDALVLNSPMPDLLNLKYLVTTPADYERERTQFGDKYVPVFRSPDGTELVLENRTVLPKAWLVPAVVQVATPQQALEIMRLPNFDPRVVALIESPPPFLLAGGGVPGSVETRRYEGESIELTATAAVNSLLVLGEKYYRGWKATVDGKPAEIQRVNYILRGVYLPEGKHEVRLFFDPLPFKVGKYLTLASFILFAVALAWDWRQRRRITMNGTR